MKHLYLFLMSMLTLGMANAQAPLKSTEGRAVPGALQPTHVDLNRAVIYTNDFSNCNDFTFINVNDDLGFGDFLPGISWECSTVGPEGSYAISPIASTSADNGFMMIDSDEFGGADGGGATSTENCYFAIDSVLDLTGHPFVTVEWENFYRQYTDAEYCLLEISLDGVTWPNDSVIYDDVEGALVDAVVTNLAGDTVAARYEVFPGYDGNQSSPNPYTHRINLGDVAGNAAALHMRFRWIGGWGYAWMLDDLQVFDTPMNDLGFPDYVSFTDYETTGLWEARTWPVSQVPAFDLAARVTNFGTSDQAGTTLSVAVNGSLDDGGSSAPMTLASGDSDTLRVEGWTPPGIGEYTLDFSVAADSTDEYPADNAAQESFDVVEFQYGRESGDFVGQFPGTDGTVDYIAAVPFDAVDDMTIYAIDVAIMDGSDPGAEVVAHLFDWATWLNGEGQYEGLIATSEEVTLDPIMMNSGDGDVTWCTFLLDEPYTVSAGDAIIGAFEHLGGDNVQIGTSTPQRSSTVFVYGPFGTQSAYAWYWTTNCPMVRLNLNPDAVAGVGNVAGTKFQLGQAYPNPAVGNTRIDFTLDAAADVMFEVTNLTGAIVSRVDLGVQPAGAQSTVLDLEGLTAGMYTYTIVVDGERLARKLIIE